MRIRADEHIVLDDGAMLVRAIVIAGDRARADVNAAADRAVADVAEMIGFAVCRDFAVFYFDEIADMHFVMQLGAGPQTCIGTDAAVSPDFAAVDMAVWRDFGAGSNTGIPDHAVSPHPHIVAQFYFTLEDTADIDLDIAPAMSVCHVHRCELHLPALRLAPANVRPRPVARCAPAPSIAICC